jgi:DeoR/GlpR family transcriptional regulator of sugar metabolism
MDVRVRRQALIEAMQREGELQVRQLAEDLCCSEMTIRRDLDVLERDGAVRRIHGGAVRANLRRNEPPYAVRALEAVEAKRRIGRAAAELISAGETIILDSGTTAMEVARAVRGRAITVLSLGLRAQMELAEDSAVRLIATGGDVRPGELSLTGELAEVAFERLRFDTYILGCCGIDAREGLTTHLPADARVQRAAIRSARRTIVIGDRSKLGLVTFSHVCDLSAVELLVTDAGPDQAVDLEALGVAVQRV